MIVILAPSKTQSVALREDIGCSEPVFAEQAAYLASLCKGMSTAQIMELMHISEKLAERSRQKFNDFHLPHSTVDGGTALTTFQGDVYTYIKGGEYSVEELQFAQHHVRILSGLYGSLRPLDMIQPYRLEMGTKLATSRGSNLYQFWDEMLTRELNRELGTHTDPVLINCASLEYSRTVLKRKLSGSMLTMSFKQQKNDALKSIAIYNKRARGMFVDWFITNRINRQEQLSSFERGGYRFSPEASSDSEYVFITHLDT